VRMEEQLRALGSKVAASAAEALGFASAPMRWKDLREAVGEDLGSKGTLTKALTRMSDAGLIAKTGDGYQLAHPAQTTSVLLAAAELHDVIAAKRAGAATDRARRLRDAFG